MILLRRSGLLTTVQDVGRWGFQSRGVPPAGPMDLLSHRLANMIVGNDESAASLEITLTGPEIEFQEDGVFAVCGAEFALDLDGTAVPMNQAVPARRGAVLRFGGRRRGARAYVGVAGGIAVPCVLGSRATHLVSGMGGLDGRRLVAGDCLPVGRGTGTRTWRPSRPESLAALPEGGARLRAMPGPHEHAFAEPLMRAVFSTRFTVSLQSNRMAYRLEGPPVLVGGGGGGVEMISDATPHGGVQIPASGQPILLMADHATTGGYPIAATVITADLPVAGQLAPGDWIEFAACTRADALAALIAQERRLLA